MITTTKQWRRVTASLMAAGLVFAACGSDDEPTADTAVAAPADTAAAEPADTADEELSVPDSPDDGVTSDVIKIVVQLHTSSRHAYTSY